MRLLPALFSFIFSGRSRRNRSNQNHGLQRNQNPGPRNNPERNNPEQENKPKPKDPDSLNGFSRNFNERRNEPETPREIKPETPNNPENTKKTVKSDALVPNPDNIALSQKDFDVIKGTNALRAQQGLPALTVRDDLMDTSLLSSKLMNEKGKLEHGLTNGWFGENIAQGQTSPKEVVQDWKDSDGHYRNLMDPKHKFIGVGEFNSMWTQQFA